MVKYSNDPWGVPTIEGDKDLAAINPCSYRGYYYDEETGYYYLQSRYYDPAIGRFINADVVEYLGGDSCAVSANIYAYCNNNPVMNWDPLGRFSIPSWPIVIAIDAAIFYVAAHFQLAWLGYMAPIKNFAKKAAARYFQSILRRFF